ncbi:hypothetical protein SmJEL517_g00429 [Synchytrium microbalum]|uniref:Uncharacterized protein n=1 Tax=Synchytrium microbalum TaxID=1806994 RepID=A0A507C8P2_9FUNG|nr:uncharacterized protein SmJEL517_g00429 [Synchytrium microbalum]TPX37427.1 hypothetical protein SmJEL517_g00429 [Synchytrium microbalum]
MADNHPSPTGSQAYDTILRWIGLQAVPSRKKPETAEDAPQASSSNQQTAPKPSNAISPGENPWYPLPGPPTTDEEKDILKQAIQQELDQLQAVARERDQKSKDMETYAASNCADLRWMYQNCLSNGTLMERSSFCQVQKNAWRECLSVQKKYMAQLGYYSIPATKEYADARQVIADKADDLYLKAAKARKEEEAAAAALADAAK